jgi:VanZ family protein
VLKKPLFTVGFVLWMAMITFVCLSSFPEDQAPGLEIPHLDKGVHFFLYLVASLLGAGFLREQFAGRLSLNSALLRIMVFLITYGIIIEVIQMAFTTSRSGEVYDVLANCIGAMTAMIILKLFYSGKRHLNW